MYSQTLFVDTLIGEKAPPINGKNAKDLSLLKLSSLMKNVYREKDSDGEYKTENGQYVWRVKRNIVVINFFATYCVPCIREIPTFNTIADKFREHNVKLLYVNVDAQTPLSTLRRFIIRHNIEVPMMIPNQYHAVNEYQVLSLPRIVIIDTNHRVSNVIVGFREDFETQITSVINELLPR